jgi:hypothetical protein
MFDALFVYVYELIGFHEVIENEEDIMYIMGIDPAIGEDFSGRI